MTRALLVCPEPLAHQQPAGIGVRFLEIARVLRDDGHDVTVLSPDTGLTPEAIRNESARAGVVVVQGHAANDLFAHSHPVPTVVDLYDPFIIENLHYYRARGAEVFAHDHATLINSVVHGDYFLCASEAQRLFYLGVLLSAGRLNPAAYENDARLDALIGIAPFGVQKPREQAQPRGPAAAAILFGGIYDWYDPLLAIDAVALARRTVPEATLTFTSHPNPDRTPQGMAAAAIEHVRKHGYGEFVRFDPWVPYDRRGEFFDRFTLSMLTFSQSMETELSMRTRIYDFLWGGLPVITSSAPGTDEILRRYEAGTVIAADSAETFAAEIVSLLRDPERRERTAAGASQFVREHQWDRTLAPLRQFCFNPRFDRTKEAFAVRLNVPDQPRSFIDRLKRRIGGSF